jgi:hypothetical protein
LGKKKRNGEKDSTDEYGDKVFHSDTKYDIIEKYIFEVYENNSGRSVVQEEIDGYDEYGSQYFTRSVMHLSSSPRSQWDTSVIKKIKGFDKLYEIRYKNDNKQTRAIGFFIDCKFIILGICTHKGKVYDPPEIFRTCQKRRKNIIEGLASSVPLKVHGENYPPDDQ